MRRLPSARGRRAPQTRESAWAFGSNPRISRLITLYESAAMLRKGLFLDNDGLREMLTKLEVKYYSMISII